MKNLLVTLSLAAAVFTMASCKKDTGLEASPSATINISSPYSNQVYQQGDTVFIRATITGNITLHGYEISIVDRSTGLQLFGSSSHAHSAKLDVNEHWVHTLPGGTGLRVHISTSINHEEHKADKFVDFTTQPN